MAITLNLASTAMPSLANNFYADLLQNEVAGAAATASVADALGKLSYVASGASGQMPVAFHLVASEQIASKNLPVNFDVMLMRLGTQEAAWILTSVKFDQAGLPTGFEFKEATALAAKANTIPTLLLGLNMTDASNLAGLFFPSTLFENASITDHIYSGLFKEATPPTSVTALGDTYKYLGTVQSKMGDAAATAPKVKAYLLSSTGGANPDQVQLIRPSATAGQTDVVQLWNIVSASPLAGSYTDMSLVRKEAGQVVEQLSIKVNIDGRGTFLGVFLPREMGAEGLTSNLLTYQVLPQQGYEYLPMLSDPPEPGQLPTGESYIGSVKVDSLQRMVHLINTDNDLAPEKLYVSLFDAPENQAPEEWTFKSSQGNNFTFENAANQSLTVQALTSASGQLLGVYVPAAASGGNSSTGGTTTGGTTTGGTTTGGTTTGGTTTGGTTTGGTTTGGTTTGGTTTGGTTTGGTTTGGNGFIGTASNDNFNGLSGPDIMQGNEGNDTLRGNDGDDTLIGGPGDDILEGGDGSDKLIGGGGADTIRPGYWSDYVDLRESSKARDIVEIQTFDRGDWIEGFDVSGTTTNDQLGWNTSLIAADTQGDVTGVAVGQIVKHNITKGILTLKDRFDKTVLLSKATERDIGEYNRKNFGESLGATIAMRTDTNADGKADSLTVAQRLGPELTAVRLAGLVENISLGTTAGVGVVQLVDTLGPMVWDVSMTAKTMILTLNETVAESDFDGLLFQRVSGTTVLGPRTVTSKLVAGNKLTLTFDTDLGAGESMAITVTDPTKQFLKDAAGNLAPLFEEGDYGVIIGGPGDSILDAALLSDAANGDSVSLMGQAGNDTLTGTANGDDISGGAGNDLLVGAAGNDYLEADEGDDTLRGDAGDDELDGGAGNDVMEGGAGNDRFKYGTGNDTMDGGTGSDDRADYYDFSVKEWTFSVNQAGDVLMSRIGSTEVDTLRNIESVGFKDSWKNLTVRVNAATDANSSNGINGTDLADTITVSQLVAANAPTQRTWIQGGAGDDVITGGTSGDYITPGEGNDTVFGGSGTLAQRLSNLNPSSPNVWDLQDSVSFNGPFSRFQISQPQQDGQGRSYITVKDLRSGSPEGEDKLYNVDTLQFSDKQVRVAPFVTWANYSGQTLKGLNMEGGIHADVLGAPASDTQTAAYFAGGDRLTGGDGDDTLYGGAGGDTLRGDKGNDTIDGGDNGAEGDYSAGHNGADVAEYSGTSDQYRITRSADKTNGAYTFTVTDSRGDKGEGVDTLRNVEVLRFSDKMVNLEVTKQTFSQPGGGNQNRWDGSAFGDDINGTSDRDEVKAGAGNDTIVTGGGGDRISGDEGDDTIDGGGNGTSGNTWQDWDVAEYAGASKRFTIKKLDNGAIQVTDKLDPSFGGLGTDTLTNVERLQFSDAQISLVVEYNPQSYNNNINGTDFADVVKADELAGTVATGGAMLLRATPGAVFEIAKPANAAENTQYQVKFGWLNDVGGQTQFQPQANFNYSTKNQDGSQSWQQGSSVTMTVKGDKLTSNALLSSLPFWGSNSAYLITKDGQDVGVPTVARVVSERDYISTGKGNDIVFGGAGGDTMVDGQGDDLYDGGTAGTGNNSWENADVVQLSGVSTRYKIEAFKYSELINLLPAAMQSALQTQYANKSAPERIIKVTDRLPDISGGDGVNYLLNVQQIRFSDGTSVDLQWSREPSWPYYRGTLLDDVIDASKEPAGNQTSQIWAGAGNDTVKGGEGNDNFVGQAGNDVFDGGSGVDEAQYAGKLGRYTVTFFRQASEGEVGTRYNDKGFESSTGTYVKSDYHAPTGFVVVQDKYADAQGGEGRDVLRGVERLAFGSGEQWQAINLSPGKSTSNGSTHYNGDVFGERIVAAADDGNVSMNGGGGNDVLLGGAGNDDLKGGAGNDILDGGTQSENGTDVARYSDVVGRYEISILRNGEVVGSFDPSVGWVMKDVATAKIQPATDQLRVRDTLDGKYGGEGVDVLKNIERVEFANYSLDVSNPLPVVTATAQGLVINKSESTSGESIYGDAGADTLTGGGGNDNINSGAGADTLVGGAGNDVFEAGAGNDTIDGGDHKVVNSWDNGDVVRYWAGPRARFDVIPATDNSGAVQLGEFFVVDLASVKNLVDSDFEVVDGVRHLKKSVFTDAARISSAVGQGVDRLKNIEALDFSDGRVDLVSPPPSSWTDNAGLTHLNVQGTGFSDVLQGGAGDDQIQGKQGDDRLEGGAGGDWLVGGQGDDVLIGGANSAPDSNGWIRTDTAYFAAPLARFDIRSFKDDAGTLWLEVKDKLDPSDPDSLGTDLLSGVETLSFSDAQLDIAVRTNTWQDGNGGVTVNHEGGRLGDVIEGTVSTASTPVAQRDVMRGKQGNDVLLGGGNGDELEGGEGFDVLDGGSNGRSGDAWRDQDTARFSGDAARYNRYNVSISGSNTSGNISIDGKVAASVTNGVLTTVADLSVGMRTLLEQAHANLKAQLFDADHRSGLIIEDKTDPEFGGDGADLLFNVESVWFRDGSLDFGVSAQASDWNNDGKLDWANLRGSSTDDKLSLTSLAELTGKSTAQLEAVNVNIDLREGDDVYIDGQGGSWVSTGKGDDYVDGGGASGTDQWGNKARDEVRFEGNFSRYIMLDVTLTNTNGVWSVSSSKDPTLRYTAAQDSSGVGTVSTSNAAVLKLDQTGLAKGIAKLIDNNKAQGIISGWLVADRLPADLEGNGVDALTRVSSVSFNDRWIPLSMQFWLNRQWSEANKDKPYDQWPIMGAGVEGTTGADLIAKGIPDAAGYDFSGDDWIRAGAGNDTVRAGAGADNIQGDAGDDVIDGGDNGTPMGNNESPRGDSVNYDASFDTYTVRANGDGSVTVIDSRSDAEGGTGTDTLLNIEQIGFRDRWIRLGVDTWINRDAKGQITNVGINGSMLSDTVDISKSANKAVAHHIQGAEGDDTLIGGDGPDWINGGVGNDVISGGLNGRDAWGNPGSDVARYDGNMSRFKIEYSVDGKTWADTASAGAAYVRVTDSLPEADGGLGSDVLDGIEGLSFSDGYLNLKTTRNAIDVDGDGRPDNMQIIGTSGNDTLQGDITNDFIDGAEGNDTLNGGKGADVLRGGAGDDVLDGGEDGTDALGRVLIDVAEYTGNMVDYTLTKVSATEFTVAASSGSDGTDTLKNIEGIQFADGFKRLKTEQREVDSDGNGSIDLVIVQGTDLDAGDALGGTTTGRSYRITAGMGNDTLTGGAGNDDFDGGQGNDTIHGGGGTDRVRYAGNYSQYTVTTTDEASGAYTVTAKNGGTEGTDTLTGIEELVFADRSVRLGVTTVQAKEVDTDGNFTLDTVFWTDTSGNDAIGPGYQDSVTAHRAKMVNVIEAAAGDDVLRGGLLGDRFIGGAGNDTVYGDYQAQSGGAFTSARGAVDAMVYAGTRASYTVSPVQETRITVAADAAGTVSLTLGDVTVSQAVADVPAGKTLAQALAEALEAKFKPAASTQGTQTAGNTLKLDSTASTTIEVGMKVYLSGAAYQIEAAASESSTSGKTWTLTLDSAFTSEVASSTPLTILRTGDAFSASVSGSTITVKATNAVFAAQSDSAALQVTVDRYTTVLRSTGDDAGTDTLRDIEQLIFSDDAVSLAPTASTKLVSNGTDVAEVLRVQGTAYADLIRGTSANEIFSGGDGADHFVFGDASGKDEIRGFQVGAGGDVLSIVLGSGDSDGLNASGLDTLAELKAQASQRDANVLVDLGGGHSVTLVGVLLSDLVDGNFEVAKAI